jgi:hypothetical protein
MASLRELLPYILGGAAGALGGQQAARPIQSAAAWSHKLREDEAAEERRDRIEAQTARRLEMAEGAEERQIEAHKQRMTVADLQEKRFRKDEAQSIKDQNALDSAREIFGERIAAVGGDPSVVGAMSVREMMALEDELKKEEKRFADIASAQQHFQENPLGIGESAQVYTGEGAFSATGPRRETRANEEFDGTLIDSKTRLLEIKANEKIADQRDIIKQAEIDINTYGPEENEHKAAQQKRATAERRIQAIRATLDEEVVQMYRKSNVPNERIEEFRNRNRLPANIELQRSHVDLGTARDLYPAMRGEFEGRDPRVVR